MRLLDGFCSNVVYSVTSWAFSRKMQKIVQVPSTRLRTRMSGNRFIAKAVLFKDISIHFAKIFDWFSLIYSQILVLLSLAVFPLPGCERSLISS